MGGPIRPLNRTYEFPLKKGQIVLRKVSAVAKAMTDKNGSKLKSREVAPPKT